MIVVKTEALQLETFSRYCVQLNYGRCAFGPFCSVTVSLPTPCLAVIFVMKERYWLVRFCEAVYFATAF